MPTFNREKHARNNSTSKRAWIKTRIKQTPGFIGGAIICTIGLPICACWCLGHRVIEGDWPPFYCGTSRRQKKAAPDVNHQMEQHHAPKERPLVVLLWNEDESDWIETNDAWQNIDLRNMACCMGLGDRYKRVERNWDDAPQIRANGPFRFMDLPVDIQLLVLEYLVEKYPGKKWTAKMTCNRDGVAFLKTGMSQVTRQIKERIEHKGEFVLWQNNYAETTSSLLLTNRQMRELTTKARQLCFSNQLVLVRNGESSKLDRIDDWPCGLLTDNDRMFTKTNRWVFSCVRYIEARHDQAAWPEIMQIFPQLEVVHLIWGSLNEIEIPGVLQNPQSAVAVHNLEGKSLDSRFLEGEFDDRILQNCKTACQSWISLFRTFEASGQHCPRVEVSCKIQCYSGWAYFDYKLRSVQVELWPCQGRIIGRKTASSLKEWNQAGLDAY